MSVVVMGYRNRDTIVEAVHSVASQQTREPVNQQKAMEWGFRPAIDLPGGPYLTAEYGINPQEPKALLGRVDPAVAEAIMGNWQEVKKPGVAVLVLDVSGSMKGAKLDSAKAGAKRFLENMGQRNQVGLVTFKIGRAHV